MSDFRTPADDALPQPPQPQQQQQQPPQQASQPADRPGGMPTEDHGEPIVLEEKEQAAGDALSGDMRGSEAGSTLAVQPLPSQASADPVVLKQVNEVLSSEQGIPTLLNRLKQSISSAKEFALFLKKRSTIEDDHAQSLKKLCRLTQDSMRRPEHRQGTFAQVYEEMMHIHERMADNGIQFASSLYQMQEDLLELTANAERSRKVWKTNGLTAEQKVVDLEQAMRKSKAKYDSLAEEYDRARTGESRQGGGGKVLGAFKAHKSAAQQEEDLLRKVQGADQIYHGHVTSLQNEKSILQTATRPEVVRALQESVVEIDSGVTLQMQKFASFNEKLLLGNGLIISPFKNPSSVSTQQPRSLRQAVSSIDNDKDLSEFVAAHYVKVQTNSGEIKYERNPVLNPQPGVGALNSSPPQPSHNPQQSIGQIPPQNSFASQQPPSMGSRQSTGNFGSPGGLGLHGGPVPMTQGITPGGGPAPPAPYQQQPSHGRSYSHGNLLNQTAGSSAPFSYGNGGGPGSPGPPQLGALSFQGSQTPPAQLSPAQAAPPFQPPYGKAPVAMPSQGLPPAYGTNSSQPPMNMSSPSKPVFGIPLNRLYERDGLAVPMVVYQCIQAVDLFGLGLEGIYRQSGSLNHINKLKAMFDSESQNPALDFRNPENFFHDVNSVTGLLKLFFRDLPDPLLTTEHHASFISAAKHDDDTIRRDSLHAIINSLPDPNYATLRALMLHLHRVMDNSHVNRMNSHNLAVILGPTLMGTDSNTDINDAGWQIKVINTILVNTYQIFDED